VSAIRGVALGIVVTALIQSGLASLGLFVVGVPFATVLTAVVFVSCIAQIGPGPVLIAPIVWAYWTGGSGWGTALLVWSLAVTLVDNVLRPVLIRKGADLPLLLVFLGVVGGLLAFGIIGIFIGPVVLAVSYSLLADWVSRPPPPAAPSPPARLEADRDLVPVAER
jgi:predicted PurR-regulated permease PerM